MWLFCPPRGLRGLLDPVPSKHPLLQGATNEWLYRGLDVGVYRKPPYIGWYHPFIWLFCFYVLKEHEEDPFVWKFFDLDWYKKMVIWEWLHTPLGLSGDHLRLWGILVWFPEALKRGWREKRVVWS